MTLSIFKFTVLAFFLQTTHCLSLTDIRYSCHDINSYTLSGVSPNCYHNSDVLSHVPQMCENHDYNFETFSMTTSDGYILNVFRITSPAINITKPPVFVQHGVAINSGSWTCTNENSIVFLLIHLGYEVYLGNFRGSLYSNKHEELTVNDPEYWKFCLDEVSGIDLRMQINFVASKTNQKILYLGHSMGTTLAFMYLSEYNEEASELLLGVIAWAPIAYFYSAPAFILLTPIVLPVLDVLVDVGINGLLYQEDFIHAAFTTLCKALPQTCFALFSTVPGLSRQFPPEAILLFSSYWPSGTSTYVLQHYLQITRDKRFQKYDYGIRNQEVYGTPEPPAYNLTNIQVPISLMYGDNDVFFSEENVQRLFNEIGSTSKTMYSIPVNGSQIDKYNHMDFLYSIHIVEYLYELTIRTLDSFQ